MSRIEESITVEVPVRTAYDQWTQFEEFPQFMEGIEQIRPTDDKTLEWKAAFGGKTHEWTAKITEQEPDQRVAWKSEDGKFNAGVVTFHRLDENQTRVMVQMDWEPDGVLEQIGGALNLDNRRVQGDLARFKEMIEERGEPTGAWRGEVDQDATS